MTVVNTLSARRTKLFLVISHPAVLSSILVVAVAALYGPFIDNPLVFDDKPLFATDSMLANALVPSLLDSRWVTHTTLAWTRTLFGAGIVPFRVGNLLLHAATAVVLFIFLRDLFRHARIDTSYTWLAFSGALLFALHPVTVYGVAYLVQRSILLATLFCLLMWYAYLEGLARQKQSLLIISAAFYYFAVFSKELSVMAPAVALALTLLLRKPSFALMKMIAPVFVLYGAIAVLVLLNAHHIIGSVYEPAAQASMIDVPERALLLSAINQSFLFFKYLLLWVAPYPGWMSVDIRVPFPENLFVFPQALGPAAFFATIASAVLLLHRARRSETKLTGFALLAPALMFITEFSTVRIQEPFVLYRSYLWFGLLFASLPLLSRYVGAKKLSVALAGLGLIMIPVSWGRLITFSNPVWLWSDAATLVEATPYLTGADRIYYNRGNAQLAARHLEAAATDYERVIELNPTHQGAYNNLGTIHYQSSRYAEAIRCFKKSVDINPNSRRPYYGLGMAYRASGQEQLAQEALRHSCGLGFQPACLELGE